MEGEGLRLFPGDVNFEVLLEIMREKTACLVSFKKSEKVCTWNATEIQWGKDYCKNECSSAVHM